MSARCCTSCDLRFDGTETCPICGKETDWQIWSTPDADWKERVASARAVGVAPDKVVMNRTHRLIGAGLDYDTALEFAQARRPPESNGSGGGYDVDVWEFERLVKRCGVALAARIMKPLSSAA